MSAPVRRAAAALAAVLLLSACAGDAQVGSEELLEFDEQQTAGPRLGERTEAAAEPTARPPKRRKPKRRQKAEQVAQQPQQAPAPQPEPEPEPEPEPQRQEPAVALEIVIAGDESGTSQFDPAAARIFAGTCARWKNTDTVPRSVEADEGAFSSGDIKPGDTWKWCPKRPGSFNYHDGTRPYAVAVIEVVEQ